MKVQCLILTLLILVAIMAITIMVKFSTESKDNSTSSLSLEYQDKFDVAGKLTPVVRSLSVISLTPNDNTSIAMAERFPYTAAILTNSSQTWTFGCFASVILVKWLVTTAHCRKPGLTHRALVYHDYVFNYSRTYPILFWRIHEKFNKTFASPKFDIALVKLNIKGYHPFTMVSAVIEDTYTGVEEEMSASVWKTVAGMDGKQYLTNDFAKYEMRAAQPHRCYESYGIAFEDESMFCVDMSDYEDCFIHEFGPIYDKDRVIGLASIKPRECDSKLAIFTNVTFYANWITRATGSRSTT